MPATLRPAVFLDRDGTIVEDVDYLTRSDQLRLIPRAAAAIRSINQMGYAAVIVTNQSAVARGMLSESALAEVHDRLRDMLAAEGAHIDGIYYCPHLPDGPVAQYAQRCDCRKPAPGMLLQAARDLGIDLPASVMIGDSLRDLEAGKAAGCATLILVKTGQGPSAAAAAETGTLIAEDLAQALKYVGPTPNRQLLR